MERFNRKTRPDRCQCHALLNDTYDRRQCRHYQETGAEATAADLIEYTAELPEGNMPPALVTPLCKALLLSSADMDY